MPSAELALRQRATAAQLQGRRALGRWTLDELVGLFRLMLGKRNMFTPTRWLDRSRLWRLILLQVRSS